MERLTRCVNGVVCYTKGKYENTLSCEMEAREVRDVLKRLAEYEETELEPNEVATVNDFVKSGAAKLLVKIVKLEKEREWIPTSKTKPFANTTVLATVKHRRWISDMGTEDEVDHVERTEVCSVYFDGTYYIKLELDDAESASTVCIPSSEQEEDIAYPIEEVLAWMPLPGPYTEDADDR